MISKITLNGVASYKKEVRLVFERKFRYNETKVNMIQREFEWRRME